MNHYGITELNEGSVNVVGIVDNIPSNEVGRNSLNDRIRKAVVEHLDPNKLVMLFRLNLCKIFVKFS